MLLTPADVWLLIGCLIPCVYCAYTDAKEKLIYNKVSLPMLAAGLIYAVYTGRLPDAVLGFGLGFGIIFLCVLLGGAGGGDLKLAAALGMWFGYRETLYVLLLGSLIGLAWGCVLLYKQGKLGSRVKVFFKGVWCSFVLGMKGTMQMPKLPEDPDAPVPKDAIPFGTCLAVAAWTIYLAGCI